jgi:hypothetical protein
MEWFRSIPHHEKHSQFLRDVVALLLDEAVFRANRRGEPVVRWKLPEELHKVIDLQPCDLPAPHDDLMAAIRATVAFSVKPGHPMFVNQLYSG